MPKKPIPLANIQESGADSLTGSTPISMNIVVDGGGAITKRPCICTCSYATSGVIDSLGIENLLVTYTGALYAVSAHTVAPHGYHNIYKVTAGGSVAITSATTIRPYGARKPIICETEALVVFSAGSKPVKVLKSTEALSYLGGSPPNATHIVGHATRLLANDFAVDRTAIRFSAPAIGTTYTGHETWNYGGLGTSGYFTAEARPDPVVAIGENTNEVYVWGATSTQSFAGDVMTTSTNDTVVYYAPTGTLEHGCIAPYSVVKADQSFAWLDNERRIVVGDKSGVEAISKPIQDTLDSIETLSDCHGYMVRLGDVECLVWSFPTDGRTFAFQKGIGWGQWAGWSDGWVNCPIMSAHHNALTGDNLVGTTGGKIGVLRMSAYSDLGDPVPAYVETGYLDRGTGSMKWCKRLNITIRRGATTSSTEPVAYLSYSDQPGSWGERIPISLGLGGDSLSVVQLGPLGTYRSRAWKFEFSPSERLSLIGIEEDYEELGV